MLYLSRDRNEDTVVGRGGKSLLSDPGSEIRLLVWGGRRRKKKCKDTRWDEPKTKRIWKKRKELPKVARASIRSRNGVLSRK